MGSAVMTRWMLLGALLALGCRRGPDPKYVTAPDGREMIVYRCRTMAQCYEVAGDLCPNGYRVLDAGSHYETNAAANALESYGAAVQQRPAVTYFEHVGEVAIRCRPNGV